MRIFGKKKEEPEEQVDMNADVDLPKGNTAVKKAAPQPKKEEPVDEPGFNLSIEEMALAVNALASTEEFQLFRKMVVGQQIAEIIENYNAAVTKKE